MWLAFVPRFLRGDSVSLEFPNSGVFVLHEPLRSHLSLCYEMRRLRMEASHQKDQPRDWSVGALRQADLQGGGRRGRKGKTMGCRELKIGFHEAPVIQSITPMERRHSKKTSGYQSSVEFPVWQTHQCAGRMSHTNSMEKWQTSVSGTLLGLLCLFI